MGKPSERSLRGAEKVRLALENQCRIFFDLTEADLILEAIAEALDAAEARGVEKGKNDAILHNVINSEQWQKVSDSVFENGKKLGRAEMKEEFRTVIASSTDSESILR